MIPKSGHRFPAFAKPASAGEARSDKIMLKSMTKRHTCAAAYLYEETNGQRLIP
jgi:hypothetical protein